MFYLLHFFCAWCVHSQVLRLTNFAENRNFFWNRQRCALCGHINFFSSQTKVYYYVIIRCYYHPLNVFSLGRILNQSLRRSDFRLNTSFDPRISYDHFQCYLFPLLAYSWCLLIDGWVLIDSWMVWIVIWDHLDPGIFTHFPCYQLCLSPGVRCHSKFTFEIHLHSFHSFFSFR